MAEAAVHKLVNRGSQDCCLRIIFYATWPRVIIYHLKIPKIGQPTKISGATYGIIPNVKRGQITQVAQLAKPIFECYTSW
jgi:hypothetical protein